MSLTRDDEVTFDLKNPESSPRFLRVKGSFGFTTVKGDKTFCKFDPPFVGSTATFGSLSDGNWFKPDELADWIRFTIKHHQLEDTRIYPGSDHNQTSTIVLEGWRNATQEELEARDKCIAARFRWEQEQEHSAAKSRLEHYLELKAEFEPTSVPNDGDDEPV